MRQRIALARPAENASRAQRAAYYCSPCRDEAIGRSLLMHRLGSAGCCCWPRLDHRMIGPALGGPLNPPLDEADTGARFDLRAGLVKSTAPDLPTIRNSTEILAASTPINLAAARVTRSRKASQTDLSDIGETSSSNMDSCQDAILPRPAPMQVEFLRGRSSSATNTGAFKLKGRLRAARHFSKCLISALHLKQ